MKARFWTAANVLMLVLFLFAAVVQFNDPDPLLWVAVYLVGAATCAMEIRRRTPILLPAVIAIVALAWAGYLGTRAGGVPVASLFAEWEMRDVAVEEAREMYGLLIVTVWMAAVFVAARTRVTGAEQP
jgi:hypothetical protein